MKTFLTGVSLVLGMIGLAGCAAESGEEAGSDGAEARERSTCSADARLGTKDSSSNGRAFNGPSLNGWTLNGAVLNGIDLNGIDLNGISLNGLTLNGYSWNGLRVNGPVLQGISMQGTRFVGLPAGADLTGAKLVGQLSDGSTIAIFIDEVRESPEAKNADVALYRVSVGDAHEPLCGRDEAGAPLFATAIANVWDEKTGARIEAADRFTFACQGGALYKCVDAGYKPWKSAELAEYHQACTRMIRADYCGDGTSYTKDGTLIDMGDGIGVQTFATEAQSDFALEATWGPNGATCVAKTRYRLGAIPSCLADRLKDSCDQTTAAEGGVKLANRSTSLPACLQ